MYKYVIKFTKGKSVRFISHLDYVRTILRSARRASLPLVFSEGFTPRPKFRLVDPLPLGYTSVAEFAEIELSFYLSPKALLVALNKCLPSDIKALVAWIIKIKTERTFSLCDNVDCYTYLVYRLNSNKTMIYDTIKKINSIFIKQFKICEDSNGQINIFLKIKVEAGKSIRPSTILSLLYSKDELPLKLIERLNVEFLNFPTKL